MGTRQGQRWHLRQGHKRYRKGKNSKRILSIDLFNELVGKVDTVRVKQGSGAIVSLLERKSRLYLVQYVPSKTASAVADTIISMLKPYQAHVHTITADNGSEFVEHERVEQSWKRRCTLRIHMGNGDRMRIAMVCCGNMCPKAVI